jgi:hypothetical protein
VTTYAYDPGRSHLVAVWPMGCGHHAQVIIDVDERASTAELAELCDELTWLSHELWDTYIRPASAAADEQDRIHRTYEREVFTGVVAALRSPHLPNETGALVISYSPVDERSHRTGRVLHRLDIAAVTDAIAADVADEIVAVEQAERGDLSGRAAQATALDRVDASPLQVEAANGLFEATPLGTAELFTALDPAAACVAAAHWLTAAAAVAGDLADLTPAAVFAESDNIGVCSVELPQFIVGTIDDAGRSPRDVVLHLLREASQVREGTIPNVPDLLARVAQAAERIEQLPESHRDQEYQALLPERLTLLDPLRPARDLLEHLLDGLSACFTLFEDCIDYDEDTGAPLLASTPLPRPDGKTWPHHDLDDEDPDHINAVRQAIRKEFLAQVREQAEFTRDRLT